MDINEAGGTTAEDTTGTSDQGTAGTQDGQAGAAPVQTFKIGDRDWKENELSEQLKLAEQYKKLHPEYTRSRQELASFRRAMLGYEPDAISGLAELHRRLQNDQPFAAKFFKALNGASGTVTPQAPKVEFDESDPRAGMSKILDERLGSYEERIARFEQLESQRAEQEGLRRMQSSLASEWEEVSKSPEFKGISRELVMAQITANSRLTVEEAATQVKSNIQAFLEAEKAGAVEVAKAKAAQAGKKVESKPGANTTVRKPVAIGSKEHEKAQRDWLSRQIAARAGV